MKPTTFQIIFVLLIAWNFCFAGVTAPNGGEQICSGSTYTITWTIDNPMTLPPLFLNKATIYFSTLAFGPFWETIAEDISNNGSWDWHVPVYTSDQTTCRIRVKTPEYDDICDAVFTIKASNIEVTAPAGGEELWPGDTYVIQWNRECTNGPVDIELKAGNTYPIASSVQDADQYSWIVNDITSDNCRIRVTDTESGVSDWSGTFSIREEPYITVTYPNGGETIRSGDPCTITWDSRGISGNVKIEYFRGSGGPYFIKSNVENTGSYEWESKYPGLDNKIKISDMNSSLSDYSDGLFDIYGFCVGVSGYPQNVLGPYHHCPGSVVDIYWYSYGSSGWVNLSYSTTGGPPWIPISGHVTDTADTSRNSIPWTIPDEPSDHVLVRIEDEADITLNDVSSEFLILASTDLRVTEPWAEDIVSNCGGERTISWISCGLGNTVLLEFSGDNGASWQDVAIVENNDGNNMYEHFNNDITSLSATSHLCKIRVTDLESGIFDESDGNFTFVVPTIEILSPAGNEVWLTGTTQDISWLATDLRYYWDTFKIGLSRNAGETWEDLHTIEGPFDSDPWEGSYAWTVTGAPSDQCLIKVEFDEAYCGVEDTSDIFTLCNEHLELIKPRHNESLMAGDTIPITWDVCGTSGLLKVEFLPAGSGALTLLGENIPAEQCTLDWVVPDLHAFNHRLTVTDMATPDIFDWVYFNIRGSCEAPSVWIPDYAVCGLDTIIVDVILSGNEDPVDSFEFTLNASNWEMVDFLDVQRGDLTEHFEDFNFTIPDPDNEVDISASSAIPIASNSQGSLVQVVTRVYCFEESAYEPNSNLTLINREGDISMLNHCAGLIEGEFCAKGDINCDHVVDDKDYQWIVDYFMSHYNYGYPECCGQCPLDVLDAVYDERITLADARVLYTAWENSILPPLDAESPVAPEENIEVTFTQLECLPGDDVDIEVSLDNPVNLSAFGLFVSYRPGFMSFESITSGGLTSDWDYLDANLIPTSEGSLESSGLLMLGGFNSEKITTSTEGTLMVLHFHVHEDAEGYSTIDVLEYYDGLREARYMVGHVGIAESGIMKLKDSRIPEKYSLGRAYPNPFNQNMRFDFQLPERCDVSIEIFDARGGLVKTLKSGVLAPGTYQIEWNGRNNDKRSMASGQYMYRLKTNTYTAIEKCILLK